MSRLAPSRYDYLHPPLWDRQLAIGKFRLHLTVSQEHFPAARHFIANRVAALRQERGMSRLELARLLNIHPSTLDALEGNSYLPSLELAIQISGLFDLPIQAIFFSRVHEDTVLVDSNC